MRRLSFSDTQSNIYTSHIHINPTYTYPLSHSHSRRYLFSRRVIFHIIIIITFIIIIISISLSQYTSCKRKLRLLFIFITCNIHTWRIQLVGGGSAISLITTIVVLVRLEIRFLRNARTVWQLRVEHTHKNDIRNGDGSQTPFNGLMRTGGKDAKRNDFYVNC